MKKFIKQIALAGTVLCVILTSCSKMNDIIEPYLDGEIVYASKVDSAGIRPGKNRVRIDVVLKAQLIETVRVFWAKSDGKTDSADIAVNGAIGRFSRYIENLEERDYLFTIVSIDKFKNRSLSSEAVGSVYGDSYESSLQNRTLISNFGGSGKLTITWKTMQGEAVRSEVKYTDNLGNERIVPIPVDEFATVIDDWASGLSYRTLYLPANAVDTFATNWETIEVTTITEESRLLSLVIGHWQFEDAANLVKATAGSDLIPNGGGFSYIEGPDGTGAVKIEAGSKNAYTVLHGGTAALNEYTLMMDIRGSQADFNNWITVFNTQANNSGDGVLWINDKGAIGYASIGGYSTTGLLPDTWQRLVLVAALGNYFKIYLNGALIFTATQNNGAGGMFSLSPDGVFFGSDGSGYKGPDYAEIALWDKALTESEIYMLGTSYKE